VAVLILGSGQASAYSVLAHEANIDAAWKDAIRPFLAARFPRATAAELDGARAYAYGGSVIQDLGYYPFGSHFFSNLLHYTRSGDFVEALLDEAQDVNELAFAIGALGHYVADNTGHAAAVNRAVALMFPKLQTKYGDDVTYAESPSTHVLVEFSFDVVQVAAGTYAVKSYHDFVGFQVSKPLLERAFLRTYGLDMKAVFGNEDLALSTYRHAVSEVIPEITRVAWRDKHEEILKVIPNASEQDFVFRLSRTQYDKDFGADYQKPGLFARFVGVLYKLLPKIGPLRPLKFEAPTREAEALFVESLKETADRFHLELGRARAGRLDLANTDFDTGKPAVRGEYTLADDTYAELLERLERVHFATVSTALRQNILAFYKPAETVSSDPPTRKDTRNESRKRAKSDEKIHQQLVMLAADVK
jgi:hypothetical protein